ncbi:hypothetical protein [Pseudomonas sp. 58 R 3]|nr:hypothetical protein [Pseudomonas sp. 58 R 3]
MPAWVWTPGARRQFGAAVIEQLAVIALGQAGGREPDTLVFS